MPTQEFTEGQTAIIELTAERAAVKASERTLDAFRKELELHQAMCPMAKNMEQAKGGWRTLTAITGALAGGLALFLTWYKGR